MAYLDRSRAERLLQAANLDALVLLSPESFYYASGAAPGVATMWRKAGAVAVLVPADPAIAEMAVVSDLFAANFRRQSHITDIRESPIWVETTTLSEIDSDKPAHELIADAWQKSGRQSGFNRPATFDPTVCYRYLAQALTARGLNQSRVGIEADALSMAEYRELDAALAAAEIVDASTLVAQLKMVKSDAEISHLREAVSLAEHGMRSIESAIAEGISRNQLADAWQQGITQHRGEIALTDHWEYISLGSDPWGGNAVIAPQDLIKVDVGCIVNGYTSDSARTWVYGSATSLQRELYAALLSGFETGARLLRPGTRLSEIHAATLQAIRGAGFSGYTRGHFGHGLGAGLGSEQWPFIAADCDVELEPGMVMAFECPWYINGLGGMIVENQLLITEHGHEMMNTLPLQLKEIEA